MAPKAIFAASRYAGALDAYIDYIKNMERRGARVGQGAARPTIVSCYIEPYSIRLATGVFIESSASTTAWTDISSSLTQRVRQTITGTQSSMKLRGYKPPRVNLVTGRATTGTVKTSNVTKLKYLDYGGTARSLPFGRKDATDTVTAGFEDAKTALLGSSASTDRKVYLIPEKY